MVGKPFVISLGNGEEVPLKLETLECSAALNNDRQGHFALVFEGPREYCLPQATYAVKSEGTGEEAIFLVPVARTDSGHLYEAVFNYLRQQ